MQKWLPSREVGLAGRKRSIAGGGQAQTARSQHLPGAGTSKSASEPATAQQGHLGLERAARKNLASAPVRRQNWIAAELMFPLRHVAHCQVLRSTVEFVEDFFTEGRWLLDYVRCPCAQVLPALIRMSTPAC